MVITNWASANGLAKGKFGSQSARSGGATMAFHAGIDSTGIKKLGDWLSDTFLGYLHENLVDLCSIQMEMLKEVQVQLSDQ